MFTSDGYECNKILATAPTTTPITTDTQATTTIPITTTTPITTDTPAATTTPTLGKIDKGICARVICGENNFRKVVDGFAVIDCNCDACFENFCQAENW